MKKKRKQHLTVYCALEGKDEAKFLEYLKSLYSDLPSMKFADNPLKGGTPDKIVQFALKNVHYDRAFAWIDEDQPFQDKSTINSIGKCWCLNKDQLESMHSTIYPQLFQKQFNLKNKKPTLIVSHPICFEGFILKILGKKLPHVEFNPSIREKQISDLNNALPNLLRDDPDNFYIKNLPKDKLEEKRTKIDELDILIKLISR